jgi:hypothetical protein
LNGKRLIFQYENRRKSDNGYDSVKRTYRCTECIKCPFQTSCAKGNDTKTVKVSIENQKQKKYAKDFLLMKETKSTEKEKLMLNQYLDKSNTTKSLQDSI